MFTLDQLQQKIHRIYAGDTDYPASGSEDYNIRTGFINDAIHIWANTEGIYWRELFKNLSDATDGDKTATIDDTTYNTPSDFLFIASFLKITDTDNSTTYYRFVKPENVLKELATNPSAKFFYITGSPSSGYIININNPKAGTIEYSYYKIPKELSNATDKPEMSQPYFIVFHVLEQLYELDSRNDMVNKYSALKKAVFNEMITRNGVCPFNTDDGLVDQPYQLHSATFGI